MPDASSLLPKGFTLDPAPTSAASAPVAAASDPAALLPKGFTLDAPQTTSAPAAPSQYPVVAPHPAPDGSGATTNLSDSDYYRFMQGQGPAGAAPQTQPPPPQQQPGQPSSAAPQPTPATAPSAAQVSPTPAAAPGPTVPSVFAVPYAGTPSNGPRVPPAFAVAPQTPRPAAQPQQQSSPALQGASDAAFATLDAIPGVSQLGAAFDAAVGHLYGEGSQADGFGQRYQQNLAANQARLAGIPAGLRVPAEIVGGVPAALMGGAAVGLGADALASAVPAAAPTLNALSNLPRYAQYALGGAAQGAAQGASDASTNADIIPDALTNAGVGAVLAPVLPGIADVGRNALSMIDRYASPIVQRAAPLTDAQGRTILVDGQPLTAKPIVQKIVGQRLNAAAENPAAARDAMNGPQEIVPGSAPTTGQLTGDKGILGLEKAASLKHPEPFVDRRQQQNAAQLASLQSQGGTGDPMDVVNLVRARRQAIDDTATQLTQEAATRRGTATAALGPDYDPEAVGAAMRDPIVANEEAARAHEASLHAAVDPDGTLGMDATPIRKAAKEIVDEQTPSAAPMSSAERQIFGVASSYKSLMPYRDVAQLNVNLNSALRKELEKNGRTPTYARLSRFRAALEGAMDGTIERRAAREAEEVRNGTMRPDQTILSRLEAKEANWNDRAKGTSGQGSGGASAGPHSGAGANGIPVRDRAGSPAGRRPGDAGRNSGLAPGAAARRSSPSLLTFLIQRGGLRDQAGELRAMDAGRARPGLVRTSGGQTLDYAREAAEEAGYLRPRSTVNDLLDAVRTELGGRRVYPPERQAELDDVLRPGREAAQQSDAIAGAREAVQMEADDRGIRLSPEEIDHAAALTAQGAHPGDALDQAVRFGESSTLARDTAMRMSGGPGVAEGAEQGLLSMPEPTEHPGLTSNWDQAAATRRLTANDATRNRARTYNSGAVGRITQRAEASDVPRLTDAQVPGAILRRGPAGLDALRAYSDAGGDMNAARDALAMLARHTLVKPDGSLDLSKMEDFRRGYARVLSDPSMKGLNAALATAEGAERVVALAAQRVKAQTDAAQRSAAARFLESGSSQDVARQVGGLFGTRNSVAQLTSLRRDMGSNEAAVSGMRRAIVQHLETNYIGNTEVGTSGDPQIKANAFKTFMRQNQEGLRQFFTENEVRTMTDIGADMTRAARSGGALRPPGESATKHNEELAKRHYSDILQVVRHLMAPASAGMTGYLAAGDSASGLVAGMGAGLGVTLLNAMRNAGLHGMHDLTEAALLHPEIARVLMARANPATVGRLVKGLSHAITRSAAVNFGIQAKDSGYQDPVPSPAPAYSAPLNALSTLGASAGPAFKPPVTIHSMTTITH